MKTNTRIRVILDPWERESFLPAAVQEALARISSDVGYVESRQFPGGEGLLEWLQQTRPEILITCWTTPLLPENLPAAVPELKYICHLAGGIKGTIPERLLEQGMLVTNWGNAISRTVAECGLMLAIAGLRRVSYWTLAMHNRGEWKQRTLLETGSLFGRRVGLHGFGVIAQELRKLLVPFGVPVMAYSPSVPDALLEEFDVRRAADLEELFAANDVVIELAALTPKNKGIVTEELLRLIPEGGVFVNIGRGAVVDEAALARVAAEGKIQVALDVYGIEPLPQDSPFRQLDNVLTLPHLGGPTIDRRQDAAWFGLENIRHYLAGEPLESQITLEVSRRMT